MKLREKTKCWRWGNRVSIIYRNVIDYHAWIWKAIWKVQVPGDEKCNDQVLWTMLQDGRDNVRKAYKFFQFAAKISNRTHCLSLTIRHQSINERIAKMTWVMTSNHGKMIICQLMFWFHRNINNMKLFNYWRNVE